MTSAGTKRTGRLLGGLCAAAFGWCWPVAGHAQDDAAAQKFREGRALYDQHKYAEATARFEAARTLAPDNSGYAQWLGRGYGLQARQARLFSRPGLATRSREALELAVKLDPANNGARSDLAAYYAAAPGFMGGGMAKASAQIEAIRKTDPYLGQLRAADLLADNKQTREAESAYQVAAAIDPVRPEARARLGWLFTENARYNEAFAAWDELLRVHPAYPRALYGLGRTAALSRQRTVEGEGALRKFLGAGPEPEGPLPARAHAYLGMLCAQRGDRTAARREYEAALHLDPTLPEAKSGLATLGQ